MKIFSDNPPSPPFSKGGMGGIFEFGGPEHLTYNEIIIQLMAVMGINKPLIHLPFGLVRLSLPFSGISRSIGSLLGKKIPSVTSEQLGLLQFDNICDMDSVEGNFGFVPMTYREALKKFIVNG
jgi:NADH dehydrogenase